nr:FAD-dependent oxidoreductase [Bacteroidia bacterium]
MKVIIVGGVAGGASCAARLRRLDEHAEILMVERGPYISYANCGLPYHVGGVIEKESSLLVANAKQFKSQFNVEVRTQCEVTEILSKEKNVKIKDLSTGEITIHTYDKLVLSPGAVSVRPPFPGIELPGIFHVRTVPDAKEIIEWIEKGNVFLEGMHRYSGFQTLKPKVRAVVIGGGFIGLEMAENLTHRGFDVTLLEMLDQVLPPICKEHARVVEAFLRSKGIEIALSDGVAGFKPGDHGSVIVETKSGKTY